VQHLIFNASEKMSADYCLKINTFFISRRFLYYLKYYNDGVDSVYKVLCLQSVCSKTIVMKVQSSELYTAVTKLNIIIIIVQYIYGGHSQHQVHQPV